MHTKNTFVSGLSGKVYPLSEKVESATVRDALFELMHADYPSFSRSDTLSVSELNEYREKYVTGYLTRELGELSDMEKTVVAALKDRSLLSDNPEADISLTFGQRVADHIATFGGSWTFILSFAAFLFIWIAFNVVWLANRGFDPYPFILLNLILSCLAAIQAPVIMMSQNRQEEKDRERARQDYMVNLKAELEIRILHEKLDYLIMKQQQELMQVQQVQVDMMKDILERMKK